jgi:hypothetical protein
MRVVCNTKWLAITLMRQPNVYIRIGNQPIFLRQPRSNMKRPDTVVIEFGKSYPFYAEMQQEYEPPENRMRRFTGTLVEVLRENDERDTETSASYIVRAWDGSEFTANAEEINGWDYALDQFFWHDATYGKGHRPDFLGNERN